MKYVLLSISYDFEEDGIIFFIPSSVTTHIHIHTSDKLFSIHTQLVALQDVVKLNLCFAKDSSRVRSSRST